MSVDNFTASPYRDGRGRQGPSELEKLIAALKAELEVRFVPAIKSDKINYLRSGPRRSQGQA